MRCHEDIQYHINRLKQANRSTVNTKTENVDTATGLPPWETVQEPVVGEVRDVIQEIKQDSKLEPVDVHSIRTSNQAPPAVSQVLLDSGWSICALLRLEHR